MLPSPMPPLALGDCLSGNDLNAFAIASQTHTHPHTHILGTQTSRQTHTLREHSTQHDTTRHTWRMWNFALDCLAHLPTNGGGEEGRGKAQLESFV